MIKQNDVYFNNYVSSELYDYKGIAITASAVNTEPPRGEAAGECKPLTL
jgi:hypothetical protein